MAILGSLLKRGIILRESLEQQFSSAIDLQKSELRKLLISARHTDFGKFYDLNSVLSAFKNADNQSFYEEFTKRIPVHDYEKIYNEWWYRTKKGASNVSWPGKVRYFALSSGTSESSSKYIPITKEMMKSIKKTSIRQILSLSKYNLPVKLFTKGILMLGGSTNLRYSGNYFEGDLSGITAGQIPFWFQHFYKPGKKIAKTINWNEKLDEITLKAKDWDIGIIVGVPAWLQILLEKIINYYKLNNIHEIWPNLSIFVHGGVSFEPYKRSFESLLAKPLIYMETYLASEGFIGFQSLPDRKSMRLVLNNGIFYEFIPFNESNFDSDGNILEKPETLKIDEVKQGVEYAMLLTTNAGAWRYLIGDVIKFTSTSECEIVITGRTKHFLSLCGEHLSLENMNKAIELTAGELGIRIREFTVFGENYGTLFAHRWFIGTDDPIDDRRLKDTLDENLKKINDDYRVERGSALKEVFVQSLPNDIFYNWLKIQGKEGGQNKFPRVLKKEKISHWKNYLQENNLTSTK